jgi:hypothetical protein
MELGEVPSFFFVVVLPSNNVDMLRAQDDPARVRKPSVKTVRFAAVESLLLKKRSLGLTGL